MTDICTKHDICATNFFARLKQYRGIDLWSRFANATRYDKRAKNFLGAIYLAAAVIWLN
ncbi:MAG: hypothetical protein F6K26_36110 [Moorea sp. SIO2I5]|nr:hypothetical protein [Moorena sp. SIO2I5]